MSPNTVVIDSESESESEIASNDNIVLEDPIYTILTKLLVNDKNETIATILTNMTQEIVLLRNAITECRK